MVGMMDVIRLEVPDAVDRIHEAGVTVRMITGDQKPTAKAIAVLCHILTPEEAKDERSCMEGKEFYEYVGGVVKSKSGKDEVGDFEKFKDLMNYLKCMARARPEDKQLMVTGLKQMGSVVAFAGDGTNDAPALKKANIGFAMGYGSTDICK